MDNLIAKIHQHTKTVFTTKDLALLWQETNPDNLKAKVAYYVKQKSLIRLTRGVFAKSDQYEQKELATSIYTPSYISFETVLRESGVLFQHYDTIFLAGPWSLTKNIDGHSFTFRKLKERVLYNPRGIQSKGNFAVATPERAFLDMIYLFPEYYFDNLASLHWDTCFDLVEIYENKQLIKRLYAYQKEYAQ
jgi:hypothetical protein